MTWSIPLPPPPGGSRPPVWTGSEFRVGDERVRVLSYTVGVSGWEHELTQLHDDLVSGQHFIDVASRRHALDQLRQWTPGPNPAILEVGCSGGHFLEMVVAAFPSAVVIGADYTRENLDELGDRLPTAPLLQFDITHCPLPDASVDAVVMINVLEHIDRHEVALAETARILKPGGVAIIEVPAGPELYDAYDAFLLHCRRYRLRDLEALARQCDLTPVFRSHLGFVLYPGFWLVKRLNQRRQAGDISVRKRVVEQSITSSHRGQGAASRLLAVERWLRERVFLPWGIRCLLTCVKG